MAKSLVIVESPAKVKSINKFLGRQYIVKSSVGHIRDLAKSEPLPENDEKTTGKKTKASSKNTSSASASTKATKENKKLVTRMGVDPTNGWAANYEILPGKEKVLAQLKEAAEKVDTIYLATDLDREGEAIAWHLRESIGGPKEKYKRVTFTEITKKAVTKAFEHPSSLNMDRVNAQQARRFLDRVVGYMVSPLLWAKVARGLSAGRVQSVAVRLISEREQEIYAFKPQEYWEVIAELLSPKGESFEAIVYRYQQKSFEPVKESEAIACVKALSDKAFHVSRVEKKPTKSKPSAPYITSTLQQAASVRLGFGVKKTMTLAQHLYEAGHITYMRTDSTNLSADAVESCRSFIVQNYGNQYLPDEVQVYSSKKSAQEAHEAIRPTDVFAHPKSLEGALEKDTYRLYEMIWRQFVSCQMTPALFDSTSVTFIAGDYELRAKGRVVRFDGFQIVQPPVNNKKNEEESKKLPDLAEGQSLKKEKIIPSQHFTKPPPRFTEASLVRELEKNGIGRPSTYASIISTIQERGYVKVENRRFFCLKMGDIVTERLVENFKDLMDYDFTAHMEEDLDKIADGSLNWKKVLDTFYADFTAHLSQASSEMKPNTPTPVPIKCPECQREMMVRTARTGVFLSCSGYALPPKERCLGTINLIPGTEAEAYAEDDDEGNVQEIQSKKRCQICDTAMDSYLVDEQRRLHVCHKNPECSGFFVESGKFRIKGYEGPIIQCDKCSWDMQLKTGRFGKYFGCTNADCKNTRKLTRTGEAAPPRSTPVHMPELVCEKGPGYFVLRDGAAGLFLASSAFPKSRETKKPFVEDLVRHKNELDPKFLYITQAPLKDAKGRPYVVRFSKKTQQHFLASEEEGKQTDDVLYYVDNKWVAS